MEKVTIHSRLPQLVKYLRGIHPFGANTVITQCASRSHFNKDMLAKRLGLDSSLRSECSPSDDVATRFPTCISAITDSLPTDLLEELTGKEGGGIIENKMPDGRKLSRVLIGLLNDNIEYKAKLTWMILNNPDIHKELPKFPHLHAAKAIDQWGDQFIQNFYSEVAATRDMKYGFSLNFWDIFAAAQSPNFISCFSADGCNARAALHLAMSPMIGVLYSKKGDSISGRCWVYFNPQLNSFILAKTYGFIDPVAVSGVANWIARQLSKENSVWAYQENISGIGDLCDLTLWRDASNREIGGAWLDSAGTAHYWDTSNGGSANLQNFMIVGSRFSPCIVCGRTHTASSLMCSLCKSSMAKCSTCGNLTIANTLVGGECPECADEAGRFSAVNTHRCKKCGKNTLPNGVCLSCMYRERCTVCGKTRPTVKYGKHHVCNLCVNLLTLGVCEVCGDLSPTYPINSTAMCKSCAAMCLYANPGAPSLGLALSTSSGNLTGEWAVKLKTYLQDNGLLGYVKKGKK